MKKLGRTQLDFLKYLVDSPRGWCYNCGWIWGNPSTTRKLLESLFKRGLVFKQEQTHTPRGVLHTHWFAAKDARTALQLGKW